MKLATYLLLSILCHGCSALRPDALLAELHHVSHPLAGYPFGPSNEEDALSQLNVLLRWHYGDWYAESGCGYKLEDAGVLGPDLTFTARVGKEWALR